jgi:hypothetical protein
MSNIRTSLPLPTQPWEAAKARFLDGLTLEECKRFKDATPENLFYDTSAAQKRHTDNSRSWLLQERISSLVDAIEEYGKALDVYSNTYGLVMSPLWGSLRIILHVSRCTNPSNCLPGIVDRQACEYLLVSFHVFFIYLPTHSNY